MPRLTKRVAVLTRDGSLHGVRLLNALVRADLPSDAVIVAEESLGRQWRLLRGVARSLGWMEALSAAAGVLPTIWTRPEATWRGEPLVRDYARLAGEVVRVASFNAPPAVAAIEAVRADWLLLGQTGILRPPVLATARCGVLNGHPGWLPEFRGVNPAAWTLAEGRPELLGSTLHLVDAGVDTGPIVSRCALDRTALPPYDALENRLYEDCIDLLVDAVRIIQSGGSLASAPQLPASGRQYGVAPRDVRRRARAAYAVLARRRVR